MPTVLITGANRGLGFEFARQYAADGWRVFATCRNPARAKQLEQLAQEPGDMFTIAAIDVTDAKSVQNAAKQLKNVDIDLLINNAGIAGSSGQSTGKVDYDAWARVLEVNTMGPLRLIESFVDHIARSERRLAVAITSGMGSLADNTSGGSIAYRTSKAALNMVMRSAAIDFGATGHQLCSGQSGMGKNRHGRVWCAIDAAAKRNLPATAH
jgi:NAD(P)-dependent dehydrogenase (short-subunit alcohol dehydrogenase family)